MGSNMTADQKEIFEVRPFVQNYAWGMRDGTGDVEEKIQENWKKMLKFANRFKIQYFQQLYIFQNRFKRFF